MTARDNRQELARLLLLARARFDSHEDMAAHLGVSRKSLTRYTHGQGNPPPGRRVAMLRALEGRIDTPLFERIGAALEVPREQWRAPVAAAPSATFEPALDLALFAAAEAHGVTPLQARRVALDVLASVAAVGIDAATAHAAITAVAAKRGGRRS
jgi:hypothetical protein